MLIFSFLRAIYQLKKTSDYSQNDPPGPEQNLEKTNYLYEITFNKPGGLVMPILVEYTYADGSTLTERYPVQIWRKNDDSYTRLLASEKEIVGVQVDPNEETADVNTTNNSWPRTKVQTDFDRFKETN